MACALQAMTLCCKAYRQSQPASSSKGGSSRCYMLRPRGPEICETCLACFCRPDCDEGILRVASRTLLLPLLSKPAPQRLFACIVDHEHHAVRITRSLVACDHACEFAT